MKDELEKLKKLLAEGQTSLKDEQMRFATEIKFKVEEVNGIKEQNKLLQSERDNYRNRIIELEDRLRDEEHMMDVLRKEYNELMEKYLKIPKKVTTTSTTIKTVVD